MGLGNNDLLKRANLINNCLAPNIVDFEVLSTKYFLEYSVPCV